LKACGIGGVAVDDAALMAAVSFVETQARGRAGRRSSPAAILSGSFDAAGKTIAIVLSGGNIDPEMLQRCLDATRSS
jgi:threonine dehydratase